METVRLSKSIEAALNAQMSLEANAAQIYLAYGAWVHHQGFAGIAKFLFKHSDEERSHMMRIVDYILKRGGEVVVKEVPAPSTNPKSIEDCFERIFGHEVDNTKSIYRLVKMTMEEEDWATWDLMQWFVKEQVEEEEFARNLLDKLKVAGGEKSPGNSLFELDRELEDAETES